MGDNTGSDSSSNPIKLAILLCDIPVPAVLSTRGTYLDIFRDLLRLSYPNLPSSSSTPANENKEASLPFILDGFDVVDKQEYPDLDRGGYRGVLISGSKYNAHDKDPWIVRLVDWVRDMAQSRPDVKLIGICFGHQIIARALGGECVPNGGKWEVGTTDMELTDAGKKVFRTDRSTLPIQQMHRDHVPSVPPSFHLLGSSSDAPVQGLARFTSSSFSPTSDINPKDIQILTVQGHPEFDADISNAIIDIRENAGVMSPEVVRDGRERAVKPHEGTGVIGRAIWRVLGVDAKG